MLMAKPNDLISVQRYESLLDQILAFNGDCMVETSQNFNYINIENQVKARDLLEAFNYAGLFPTIPD